MVDMRQVNKVWDACNWLGEWCTYAIVGNGKNSIVVTLHVGSMIPSDQDLIGRRYFKR